METFLILIRGSTLGPCLPGNESFSKVVWRSSTPARGTVGHRAWKGREGVLDCRPQHHSRHYADQNSCEQANMADAPGEDGDGCCFT